MHELELKFRLDAAAVARWRGAILAIGGRRLRLRARYFDTVDGRLGRALVALRLRLEGRRWIQTLKAAGDGPVQRLEHNVDVPTPVRTVPMLDIARHAGSPAMARLEQALGRRPASDLVERFGTDVQRLHAVRVVGASRVEVALDIGSVVAGHCQRPLAELEFEHLDGPIDGMFEWAAEAARSGGMWLSTFSKAHQGECLAQGMTPAAVKALDPPRELAHADGPALLRGVLLAAITQVLANAGTVGDGQAGTEALHQLRVGLRRLRTALRELADLSPRIDPAWEPVLADTFRRLGERRDNDAVGAAVRPWLEAVAAPRTEWAASTFADPVAAVREPAFQVALVQILALAHAGDAAFAPISHAALVDFVTVRLERLHRQVLREGRHFDRCETDRQHRVRKRLKRLRYLAEFVGPMWAEAQVARYLKRLTPAQDALGVHNDGEVAIAHFRRDAQVHPQSWFAVGYLQARTERTARDARRALRRLDKARPFWR